MFNELIYTRCREGISILRGGQPETKDGLKAYSCSPELLTGDVVDIPFLDTVSQERQPAREPMFMDDAYLYFTPDKGENFLINCHPLPYDAKAEGNYVKRPNAFINHALIGDFSGFYPFELFGDNNVWYAKLKGEAYYYATPPTPLAKRNIVDPPSQYTFDDIAGFIADGRKEALAKAVSFVIDQYSQEPERRKYLVIKDVSSTNIEMWIAAIQAAFSPRIAAGISFATRMENFLNINKYRVNQAGEYQLRMNLQDPSQKTRIRAMIIGVDEREGASFRAAPPQANAPYVVLDGKVKQAMFEANITSPYFQLIARFDGNHQRFCREFLQTFDVKNPDSNIFTIYNIFSAFDRQSLPDARSMAGILAKLGAYKAFNTAKFHDMYKKVFGSLSNYLQEDIVASFEIVKWLESSARVIEDATAKQRLTDVVCRSFIDLLFPQANAAGAEAFWGQIRRSEFARDVAHAVCDINTIMQHKADIHYFKPQSAVSLLKIFIDASGILGRVDSRSLESVTALCLGVSYHNKDMQSVGTMISLLSKTQGINVQEMIFNIAKYSNDVNFTEFLVGYMIDSDKSIVASDSAMVAFCNTLVANSMEHLTPVIVAKRLDAINDVGGYEQFINTIRGLSFITEDEIAALFESIDKRVVNIGNRQSLAAVIQKHRPEGARCINSAHILALDVLTGKINVKSLSHSFHMYYEQGVPAWDDLEYVNAFVNALVRAKLGAEEAKYFLGIVEDAPACYYHAYAQVICENAAKLQEKWNMLIASASESSRNEIFDALVDILLETKPTLKSLSALESLIIGAHIRYFRQISDTVWDIAEKRKAESKSGGLFGFFRGGNKK